MAAMCVIFSILTCLLARLPYAIADGTGTIQEPDSVNLLADAKKLHDAMSGWGTNEAHIIDILTQRSYDNRMELLTVYDEEYGESLWEEIKSETSSHFRTALKGLVLPHARFLAEEMRNAMSGWGTNEDTLILCLMLTINEYDTVQDIKSYYKSIYNGDIQEAIEDETSSPLEDFLVGVLNRPKFDESAAIDEDAVKSDLSDMKEYMGAKRITDIVHLVTSRSLSHLAALQETYYQDQKSELYVDLDSITDHHIQDGLISLMSVASDYYRYCAYELHASMDGAGTDEGALTRIIVTRADKDLQDITKMYSKMFGKELEAVVKADTSGDYEKTLVGLIN